MTTFTGFSEEDLQRMKISGNETKNVPVNSQNVRKIDKIGFKPKKVPPQITLTPESEDAYNTTFDKCKLSLKSPTPSIAVKETFKQDVNASSKEEEIVPEEMKIKQKSRRSEDDNAFNKEEEKEIRQESRRSSLNVTPDVLRCGDNYTEDELEVHRAKLEDLQLKQKIMEEQNKKRKEMLAKALADRTKQTEEEVLKLEKIKKELEILDGQLSKDVAMLRKKIDQASVSYSEAEKQYLKVEKEFLQSKINLQKEKEKKELLIEHLCTLITYNETRKAEKLETLMSELANDKKDIYDDNTSVDESPIIIDGVDERTGKIMDYYMES